MKHNELKDLIYDSILKKLEIWKKKNRMVTDLEIVQQINLATVELRKLSSKIEEEYKSSI